MKARKVRKENGLSLSKASKKLGISKSYLSKMENGKRRLTSKLIRKMKEVYGESVVEKTSSTMKDIDFRFNPTRGER